MAAEGHAPTSGEYITHHLQHWQKNFSFENAKQVGPVDFSVFNFDSLLYTSVLGLITLFVLWLAARRAHSGVPVASRRLWRSWSRWSTTRPRP